MITTRSLTAVALLFTSTILFSQQYVVKTTNTPYINLVSPRAITPPGKAGEPNYFLDIPFKMKLFGRKLNFGKTKKSTLTSNCFIVEANGFKKDKDTTLLVFAMGAYSQKPFISDNTSSLSYELTGRKNKRVLKFQWKNMKVEGNNPDDYFDMQVWLTEADNSVSFHFGPQKITGSAGFLVGENNNPTPVHAPELGIYITDITGDWKEKFELCGDPKNPTVVTALPDCAVSSMPLPNTLYTFSLLNNK